MACHSGIVAAVQGDTPVDGQDDATGEWDFFVSYTQSDLPWAEWIAWQLEEAGFRVLMQAWDFVPGTRWTARIQDGLHRSRHTIAVLSAAYLASVYGTAEWAAAAHADPLGMARRLVPIRVEDCERPGLLGDIVSFDLFDREPREAESVLLDRVTASLAGRAKPVASPAYPGATAPAATHLRDRELILAPGFPGPGEEDVRRRLGGTPSALYRDDPAHRATATRSIAALSPTSLADRLAIAVRAQWTAEAELRRLNDPYVLPVQWTVSGTALPPAERRGAGTVDLAGSGDEIGAAFLRFPATRMMIIGGPGAGKTVLLMQLLFDLLRQRVAGSPVPVLLTLSSWDPAREPLAEWLAAQLAVTYPALAAPAPALTNHRRSLARALVDEGLVVPLLDGLDELPAELRADSVARINRFLQPDQPIVVTCRTDDYQTLVASANGLGARLNGSAVVEIEPLGTGTVADYLRATAGTLDWAGRWELVISTLSSAPDAPLTRALATPLAVALARAVYSPFPIARRSTVPSPVELCDRQRFPTAASIIDYLFDGYVAAVYPPHRGEPGPTGGASPWNAAEALRYHRFLARHLIRQRTTDLAWWAIPRAVPAVVPQIVPSVALGLAAGTVSGLVGGPALGAGSGLAVLAVFLLATTVAPVRPRPQQAVRRIPTWREAAGGLGVGLIAAVVVAVVVGAVAARRGAESVGAVAGVVSALGLLLTAGFDDPSDLDLAVSPAAVLRRDRASWTALGAGLGLGTAAVVAAGLLVGVGIAASMAGGLAAALIVCAALWLSGGVRIASAQYVTSCVWLACWRRTPLYLMAFLADAHRRGVLRQTGATYQYRHAVLQRRLAGRR